MSSQKPWYEKTRLDPQFPFQLWETALRGFPLHWHEPLEIVCVRSGTMSVMVEGVSYDVVEGDVVIVNSGSIHGFSRASFDISVVLVQFGLEIFDQALVDLRDRIFQKSVFGRRTVVSTGEAGDVYPRFEKLVSTMQREYQEKKEGYRLAIKAALYELALILLRHVPARRVLPGEHASRQVRNEMLEKIFGFVHKNYGEPIDLEAAAGSVPLSKFYFSRFFKEQTGQTFHGYLARVRVSRAEELLVGTDLSITEIAYQSGFVSLKTFNRIFQTYIGTSPTRYRQRR